METGMIIKSVIAGLTLGGAAFGGVYYGLPSITPEGAVKPADMARLEPVTPQTQDRHTDAVIIAEAHPHPEKMKPKPVEEDEEDVTPSTSEKDDKPETKWIDNYLKKSEAEDPANPDVDEATIANSAEEDSDDVDIQDIIDRVKGDVTDEPDMTSESNPVKTKIVTKIDSDAGAYVVKTRPASEVLNIVLREAKAIQSDDLKDQAHMDIIDYALRMRDYEAAKEIIALVNQPELRETARSRVAVSYAENGEAEAAFDMLGSVEMEDFGDVMRLQVIEALTHAKRMSDITK